MKKLFISLLFACLVFPAFVQGDEVEDICKEIPTCEITYIDPETQEKYDKEEDKFVQEIKDEVKKEIEVKVEKEIVQAQCAKKVIKHKKHSKRRHLASS